MRKRTGLLGRHHDRHTADLRCHEYRLIVFPVTVGSGRRLFTPDAPASGYRVLETRTTSTGAVYSALVPTPFTTGAFAIEDGAEVVV